jgi:hypothetical protein
MRAAIRLAHSDLDDEAACAQLRESTRGQPHGIRSALSVFGSSRDEFDSDRAYRLLQAVVSGGEVLPMTPRLRERFEGEARLGRMPMSEAVGFLRELQPALPDLRSVSAISLNAVLGPRAEHSDMLVCSQLALSIATQYLAIVNGRRDLGSTDTAYFAVPRKIVVSLASGP